MSNFMNALNATLGTLPYNKSVTENGAIGYKTTQHPLLDMNFKASSYRGKTDREIVADFVDAYNENPVLAIKWAFYARDVRGGMGERRLFRVIMRYLADAKPEIVEKLLPLFAEYGRWDDVVDLYDTQVGKKVFALVKNQLTEDMDNLLKDKPVSLCAKWLKSCNSSSKETVKIAKAFVNGLGISEKQYRKMLSALREKIRIVERDMSAQNWEAIDYQAVPSKANINYKDAFLRHDEERRNAYLASLEKGEVKINGSTNFPHDVVHQYCGTNGRRPKGEDATLEALWKALPNYDISNTMVVADGSGSMHMNKVGNTTVSALEVANALAIYCSERNKGQFKNNYITFSETPQYVKFNEKATLHDKIAVCLKHDEVANTNIEAVFNLILDTAVRNHMSQEDLPKNILIISDMEFDSCACSNRNNGWHYAYPDKALFEELADRFERAGYKMPRLCFWNVYSRTSTIPVKENDMGVALVSGFSPAVLKMVMSDCLDPYQNLVNALNSERYQAVEDALNA